MTRAVNAPITMIKRSLSESSAEERNRSIQTTTKNSSNSRKMWNNELIIDPDREDTQPQTKRRQLQSSDEINLDKNGLESKGRHRNQNHVISDLIDVGIRITMVVFFIKLETMTAFQRNIHIEEIWLYKNPRTADIVSPQALILSVIIAPFLTTILHFSLKRDRRDFRAANWAWTMCLCLNGITTSLLKITTGRPRPDFFYRCFPDGEMPANVTLTAINVNCSGKWRDINEGYKSFPSGHSSFAFNSFGFIAFYLAGKLHAFNLAGRGETWRVCASLIPLMTAALIGVSRTCDYHHHWQDVVVGSLIGICTSYLVYRQYYPSIFARNSHRPFPRDGRWNAYNEGCKYVRIRSDFDDLDESYASSRFMKRTTGLGSGEDCVGSDDQLPLLCDEDDITNRSK